MSLIDDLDRTWHAHFDAPIVHHNGLDAFRFNHSKKAVHVVDGAHGAYNISFYSQFASTDAPLSHSKELVVSLHGAATGPLRYPQFRRVESLQDKAENILSFADPTLQYSVDADFRIGWYAGGGDWDPLLDFERIIRDAQLALKCEHVAFIGSSAGGHAALRLSARFEGSLAFVMDPQTNIAKYYWPSRNRLFEHCWPQVELKEAMASSADRIDLVRLYGKLDPKNFIYYRQSTGDSWHQRVHAEPFQVALESLEGTTEGRFAFVFEMGEKEGHGKITSLEFDTHYRRALKMWRDMR